MSFLCKSYSLALVKYLLPTPLFLWEKYEPAHSFCKNFENSTSLAASKFVFLFLIEQNKSEMMSPLF